MKKPDECQSILDIRDAVNEYDHRIIQLLGERYVYVREAVRFKKGEEDIRRPGHIAELLEQRRAWAREANVDEDFVESIYRTLTDHSFDLQYKLWQRANRSTK